MTPEETLKLKAKARLRLKAKQSASMGDGMPQRNWLDIPGEAMSNIGSSAYSTAEGLYNIVRHPVDTLQSGIDATIGGLRKLTPAPLRPEKYMLESPETTQRRDAVANAAGEALTDRYGGMDQIKNTLATDPVGSALDIGSILAGGAGLAGRGPLIAGKTVNTVQQIQKMPRATEALLRRAAPKSPQGLARLGNEAMLLDASPSMTGLAQGVVTKPSPHSDALVKALVDRMAGRSDRLLHGTQNTLGRLRDPVALKSTIDKAGRRSAGPHYRMAKQNPPDIRSPILDDLIARQMTEPAKGMTTSNRAKNLEWMNKIEDAMIADNPQDVVSRLHDLRKELDTYTAYNPMASSAEKAARDVAQNARNVVDDILKNRVPGFMEGDKIISTSKKAQEAIDFGYDALEGGKSTMFPETFAKEYAKRDPRFIKEGMKGRIANAMGTNANDTAALKRVIGDGNDFNRRKMVRTFGEKKTNEIVNAVEREQAFGENYADIARNSQTARRLAAQKLVEGADGPRISQGASIPGLLYGGAAKGLNALMAKGVSKYSAKNAEALAKALQLKGVNARKLAAELAKSKNQGDKLRKIVEALIAAHAAETVNRPHR
jgi:hypothetical protein